MLVVFHQPVQADRTLLPQIVDGQISRDRIKPGAEFVTAVVLVAAFQHADPCFLEEVLRQFTISRQIDQITKKPVLVLLDETVQQVGITPAEATSNCAGLGFHRIHEAIR